MKTKHILLLIGFLVLAIACKKNEYSNTSTTNQPVFYFKGTINNAPVNIQAGVNNYNMNTSYSKDSNGVYDYMGLFTIPGSPSNCPNSLELYIKDYRQYSVSNPTTIDSLITPGYFDYATPAGEPTGFYVTLLYFFNHVVIDTNWNFGDGQTGKVRIHYYYHPGIYNVSLAINSASCTTFDTNTVLVGEVGNAFLTPFSPLGFSGNQTQFSAVPTGVAPYTYTWNYGDPLSGSYNTYSNTSIRDTGTHNYTGTGVYPVSVTTTDATGYTAVYRSTIATPGATGCAGGFFEMSQTPNPNPYNLNDVGIEWYDAGGNLWKSENNKQRSKSLFQISSVAEYKTNSLGQATKIINATVTCELYNGIDSIPLNGNVVFGVAHF
ncbi:MAG TPA: hypothetical protein VNZ45_18680 [Bacteroidia bacterium]|jgi:hypothetical protein|nr:hypothetical protein [Bacteroidia bacterium]